MGRAYFSIFLWCTKRRRRSHIFHNSKISAESNLHECKYSSNIFMAAGWAKTFFRLFVHRSKSSLDTGLQASPQGTQLIVTWFSVQSPKNRYYVMINILIIILFLFLFLKLQHSMSLSMTNICVLKSYLFSLSWIMIKRTKRYSKTLIDVSGLSSTKF